MPRKFSSWFNFDNRLAFVSEAAEAMVLSPKRGWVPVDATEVVFTAIPLSEAAAREAFAEPLEAWGDPSISALHSGDKVELIAAK